MLLFVLDLLLFNFYWHVKTNYHVKIFAGKIVAENNVSFLSAIAASVGGFHVVHATAALFFFFAFLWSEWHWTMIFVIIMIV